MNDLASNTVAPIQNVSLCTQAIMRAMDRSVHLPGLVTFYGPSGFGKSVAAAYVANRFKAYYVEAKSSWTRKALLQAILREMGIDSKGTIYDLTDMVSEQLVLSQRPLIIDEMDHIVERNAVETVRDIYESSNAAMLLIGEERLPQKLKEWERFHGRMLDWVPAQPADMEDARHLRNLYCRAVDVSDDLLELILEKSNGSTRRICINLDQVQSHAQRDGRDSADGLWWGNRQLFTGEAPRRRL